MDAASIDGAGLSGIYFRIMLPLVMINSRARFTIQLRVAQYRPGPRGAIALLVVLAFSAMPLAGAGLPEASPPAGTPTAGEVDMPSLAGRYRDYFLIGAAVNTRTLVSQRRVLEQHVNCLTAENDMKWERIHPKPGGADSYDFAAADEIVSFAAARGFVVRGHTLVWHQQVPGWVFGDAAETLSGMKDHITTLVSRYRGSVFCWDVVNEAVSDDGGWRTDSPWYRAAGSDRDEDGIPDYIVRAFEYARAADPQAKLFYNDYNIEAGLKLERAFSLARALAARGLIDGIGIQGHWSIWDPDPRTVGAAIRRFASLGLEVHITELDLSVYRWGDVASLDSLPAPLEEMQAKRYAELFGVFREEASAGRLAAVTFWGIADDYTWLDQFPVKGRKNWPLLFDEHHRPKQAFWSVVRW